MMDEPNSYRLSTLQKKHPYLSQLNNWTSKESSTGFLDSEFTDNKEEIVSGLEETTNKLWFVKPLKSNKIKPLSFEEITSATSKLPSLEILSSTKGSGLLEKQAECVAQLNMKPLPKIESHFDERTKAECEDSKEEGRKSNLYESKTDAKQNDDELSITHEVTHEVDHELSKQRDSRRPSKRAGIIRVLKISAAAVFVISLAVIICIKTFGESSSENFASKTNNSSGRSGSAEARKEYSEKKEKEVLLNEERTDHHVIVSKMETPKLNSVTQSLYMSLSDNELRYAVTPHLEKVNSKGITQSHYSTNFSKGPVLSFLIAQTITVTQSHGYSDFRHRNVVTQSHVSSDFRHRNIVTQSYGSTHFRNEPMPSFLGVQGNALTHGSSDVRHSNAVTQSHGSTDFLFAASSSPVTQYHLSDFRHSNIVTQSHGSTGFLTRLVPSPLVVPSNSRVEFLLSFATPSNAVTQSLEANTRRSLSSLFVDPSNAVTQSLQVNTESINSEYGKCQEGDFHRHPVHCTKYLRCNHGKWQERNCGRGTVFNPKINVCDWDRNVQC